MSRLVVYALLAILLVPACGGSSPSNPCNGVVCDDPPPDGCHDQSTRLIYRSPGDCNQETGECSYPTEEQPCDSPPADNCQDSDTLTVYDPQGHCAQGQCDYTPVEQDCPHGCADGQCQANPNDEFELVVPEDTLLCSTFAEGDDCVRCSWESKSRVTLRAGTFVMPKDQEEFELDWVMGVEVSPGEEAGPAGAGLFTRNTEGDLQRYEYRRIYLLGDQEHELVMRVDFSESQPVLTLDAATLNLGERFHGSVSVGYQRPKLISCDYSSLESQERILLMGNGDRLELSLKGFEVMHGHPWPGMTYRFDIAEARFTRGPEQRTTDEFFLTAATLNHHGPIPSYWVILEEPLDGIHALTVDEFCDGTNLSYLDENFEVIDTQGYQY